MDIFTERQPSEQVVFFHARKQYQLVRFGQVHMEMKVMKKSCPYCGRIHEKNYDCGRKPRHMKKYNSKDKFRSTAAWQDKRTEIKERDYYLCQACIRNLHGTVRRLNHERLEVHHIIPLEEDEGKKLDNQNLITLCERHHEMAEQGKIPRGELLAITAEIYPPGGEI